VVATLGGRPGAEDQRAKREATIALTQSRSTVRRRLRGRSRAPTRGRLLHPSIEGRRLLDQALTAADELGMTSLAKRAPTPRT
jgi:hypothetical protein